MILDGKKVSQRIKEELKNEVIALKTKSIKPGLAVIIVEGDNASRIYVNNKKRACEEIGIYSEEYCLPGNAAEEDVLDIISVLNGRGDIHGILVQLPLPGHMNEKKILLSIDSKKDVDAFHPVNVGKIMIGNYDFLRCTPAGVMALIAESGIEIAGKDCVVVGRSNIVGKPQAMLLLHKNGTVTICHSKTENLAEKTRRADILVAAVGRSNFITADMVREGAVVIDVGMNRLENGKLCGDVMFDTVKEVAGYITPVPGGVGPMTIAMLMKNTVRAAVLQNK
jgi:methylenetetrahydrofolate dehydrogenase (NADP+)/methenyltetrahydrofolate cyclohydrolase